MASKLIFLARQGVKGDGVLYTLYDGNPYEIWLKKMDAITSKIILYLLT